MPSDVIVNEFKKEMVHLAIEYLEGRIEPERLELLDKLLTENPQARAIYQDVIRLQAGLKFAFEEEEKAETPIPTQTESDNQNNTGE